MDIVNQNCAVESIAGHMLLSCKTQVLMRKKLLLPIINKLT
jgi:hypothetical protein